MIAPLFEAPSGLLADPDRNRLRSDTRACGLGSARTIADQLSRTRLHCAEGDVHRDCHRDARCFWANRLGWLDLACAMPTTDVVPQLIGAILFGAGFAIASLCPGTACVSRRRNARRTGDHRLDCLLVPSWCHRFSGRSWARSPNGRRRTMRRCRRTLGVSLGRDVREITLIAVDRDSRCPIASRRGAVPAWNRGAASLTLSPLAASAALALALARRRLRTDLVAVRWRCNAPEPMRTLQPTTLTPSRSLNGFAIARRTCASLTCATSLAADDYRIPGAEDVPVARLIVQLDVARRQTLVLYGDGSGQRGEALRHPAWAWRGEPCRCCATDWPDGTMKSSRPRIPSPNDTAAVRAL